MKDIAGFYERMEKFFGMKITDGNIVICPLESITQFYQEGKAMHHCVYKLGYYNRPDRLILSAKDTGGKRIETIEVNLKTLNIVQSRGRFANGVSEISRPDSKTGEEEYEPDSSENDSVKMPRIRTIVPEFWEDERFSNVSLPACLLYIGMKNFADDSGVILANETIIKSKVFPAREDIRKQQVSGWLQELIENSILVPFTFENKSYYVMDFSSERIDKPQKSKIPAEVIENVLSGKNRSNPGTFENIPEQSGTIENPPAGKESKGEDGKERRVIRA